VAQYTAVLDSWISQVSKWQDEENSAAIRHAHAATRADPERPIWLGTTGHTDWRNRRQIGGSVRGQVTTGSDFP
jgi:hypothetical protein